MTEFNQQDQNQFIIEKIKERPVNRKKLARRSLITASMAVIFGIIACFTFAVLQPLINHILYPAEKPNTVVFPEDTEEMSPEQMLTDIMEQQGQQNQQSDALPEDERQISIDYEQYMRLLRGEKLDVDSTKQIYTSMKDYVRELNRSMVTVTGISSDIDVFEYVGEQKDQSYGVIVADNKVELLILTAYENIRQAQTISVVFRGGYGTEATMKQYDEQTNLAILAVPLAQIPENAMKVIECASLGSSSFERMQGTPVVALGNIMGTGDSMGYGMIAGQDIAYGEDANYKLLQTDIYGSTSAQGVLFNLQGSIVGMICGGNTGTDMANLITAHGISDLRALVEKMSNETEAPRLGISGMDVSEEANVKGVPYGAYVRNVTLNSPAMLAGIQQGDVIIEINDQAIASFRDFTKVLYSAESEETVTITAMRQSQEEYKEMEFIITLGTRGE